MKNNNDDNDDGDDNDDDYDDDKSPGVEVECDDVGKVDKAEGNRFKFNLILLKAEQNLKFYSILLNVIPGKGQPTGQNGLSLI